MNKELKKFRASIDKKDGLLLISIPVIKKVPVLIFLTLFFGAWLIGEKIIVSLLLVMPVQGSTGIFFLLWFMVWTSIGFIIIIKLLWQLTGREEIIISPVSMKIGKAHLGIISHKEYFIENIKNLRIRPDEKSRERKGIVKNVFFKGYILFDYGIKNIVFLNSSEIDEAENIFEAINKYINEVKQRN